MVNNQSNNQTESNNQTRRGGARRGAGRKHLNIDARYLAARSDLTPLKAQVILSELIDERRMWLKVFSCPDERVILQALMYLQQMRDGKPSQQINVTSMNMNITIDEISKVRQVIREVIAPTHKLLSEDTSTVIDTPSL